MYIDRGVRIFLTIVLLSLLSACSGGGGVDGSGGGNDPKPKTDIEGTAAIGSPLQDIVIEIKGRNGLKKSGKTDTNGKFKINVDGLEAPFILKANHTINKRLYTIAHEKGVNNIHPVSDVVARNWYRSRQRDIDAEFDSDDAIENPPLKEEISKLIEALRNLLVAAYQEFSIENNFDFQHSPFNADSTLFDRLLDHIRINIKSDKITIVLIDPDNRVQVSIILEFDLTIDLSTPDIQPPTTPENFVAYAVSDTDVILVWNPSTDNVGVAGYRIYRDDVEQPFTTAFPLFSFADLESDKEYCFTIAAFDGAGLESTRTEVVCITPESVNPSTPQTVSNLVATPISDSEISLTWQPSPSQGIIGYDILRGPFGTAVSEKIASVVISSHKDFNLQENTGYCYSIMAFNASGARSAASMEACATTTSFNKPASSVNIPAGTYNTSQTIILSCNDSNGIDCSAIYYTLDGSEPTTNSSVYNSPITISESTTLKFFAVDSAGNMQSIQSVNYTIDSIAPVSSANPPGGNYPSPQSVSLTCTDAQSGCAAIYYTIDGSEPNTTSTQYSTPIQINSSTTLKFFARDNAGNEENPTKIQDYVITPPGDPIAVDVSVLSQPVSSSGRLFYAITVSNKSLQPANNINVTLTVPTGLLFSGISDAQPNTSCSSNVCNPGESPQWSINQLAAGASTTIHINAQVQSGQLNGDTITLTGSVNADEQPSVIPISKPVSVNNNPSAHLALSADKDPVMPGETYKLNIEFGNISALPLSGTELRLNLPEGVTVQNVSNGGTDSGNGEIVWELSAGNIAVGAVYHREVSITAPTLPGSKSTEILKAVAQLSFNGGTAIDVTAEHAVTILDSAPVPPALAFNIGTAQSPVASDDTVYYSMTISNVSFVPLNNVNIMYRVPTGMQFSGFTAVEPNTSCSGNICNEGEEAVWTFTSIPAGGSQTVNFNASILAGQLNGSLLSAPIRITANEMPDTTSLIHTTAIRNVNSAHLILSADKDPVQPGEDYTLNIDLGNVSALPLTNVELRVQLPPGVSVQNVSNSGIDMGAGEVIWNFSSIAVGESLHREILVTSPLLPGTNSTNILASKAELTFDGGNEIDIASEHVVSILDTAPVPPKLKLAINTADSPAIAGGNLDYSITVSNVSFQPVNDVKIMYRVPAGIQFNGNTEAEPNTSCSANICNQGEEAVWTFTNIPAGGSKTIQIHASVLAGLLDASQLTAPIRVSAVELNDIMSIMHTVPVDNTVAAQLSLSANKDPIMPGETYSLRIHTGNISILPLSNAELRLGMPAGVTVENTGGGIDTGNGEIVWSLPNIAVGESILREVTITAPALESTISTDILTAKAQLTFDGGAEVDNKAEHHVTLLDTAPSFPQILFDISTAQSPAISGGTLHYAMNISNVSFQPISDVVVKFRVPVGVQFNGITATEPNTACSGNICNAGEEATWTFNSIPAGGSETINLQATVLSGLVSGTLINTQVRAQATEMNDIMGLVHTVAIDNSSVAQLNMSAITDPLRPGDSYSLKLDVGNPGVTSLTGSELRAFLPPGITILNTDGGTDAGNGQIVWDLANIATGASLSRTVTITAPVLSNTASTDILKSSAQLSFSGGIERDLIAEHAVTMLDIAPSLPALSISVATSSNSVISGGTLTYTLTVSNTLAVPINNVKVIYRVPRGIQFNGINDVVPTTACSGNICNEGEEASWPFASIGAGLSESITINADVLSGLLSGTLIQAPISATANELDDTVSIYITNSVQ